MTTSRAKIVGSRYGGGAGNVCTIFQGSGQWGVTEREGGVPDMCPGRTGPPFKPAVIYLVLWLHDFPIYWTVSIKRVDPVRTKILVDRPRSDYCSYCYCCYYDINGKSLMNLEFTVRHTRDVYVVEWVRSLVGILTTTIKIKCTLLWLHIFVIHSTSSRVSIIYSLHSKLRSSPVDASGTKIGDTRYRFCVTSQE